MSLSKSPLELYIIEAVKNKRKKLKKSQEDIAKVLGVTVGYIGQIESKKLKSMYSYNQLNELAKYFKCSPKDFMPEEPVEE
ncbi:helix-turn-helix domain-containing protein [Sphingobacterium sp. SGR-19]|uniref:helix-turn-helix domain-containing protein n=1 Tax=Sphingobacterium sp. SGR-19 TaxID=2710886 RepID=UPI0013ED60DF|nr:helix-turn-helix transcriptional regulator [Sphingobacterium sp. SGR-19]NGM65426.1 helix-turn-helix transcriptional regulator [Sphingobacterium sp. SGR-19]